MKQHGERGAGPRSGSRQHSEQGWIREMTRSGTVSRGGSSNATMFSKTLPQITSGGCREASCAHAQDSAKGPEEMESLFSLL